LSSYGERLGQNATFREKVSRRQHLMATKKKAAPKKKAAKKKKH
jgi:hypothetical protein